MSLTKITFFERFESDILAGKKTITIRDGSEKDFAQNSLVQVSTFENDKWFCTLKIKKVLPIQFDELTELHAEQENMTLEQLKNVIKEIYPNINELYLISYELV